MLILAAILLLLCTGCNLTSGDSLFALPKLSGEYLRLQTQLDGILASGASYTVTNTGTVRQSVQMVDLDGDNQDEVVALFQREDGVPEVYVFRRSGDSYVQAGVIEGTGTAIQQIQYFSRSTEGQKALAISWAFADSASYGMTVVGLAGDEIFTMLDTQYITCLAQDLGGDGVEELTFINRNKTSSAFSVSIYQLEGDSYHPLCEGNLCNEAKTITSLQYGSIDSETAGLFVDSMAAAGGYVTDVLAFDGQTLKSQTRDDATGTGMVSWRSLSVLSGDVNGDGILEIPLEDVMLENKGETAKNKLAWCTILAGVVRAPVSVTYHSIGEGWYLNWPEIWGGDVTAKKTSAKNVTKTVFSIAAGGPENQETEQRMLLTLWTFTGDSREEDINRYAGVGRLTATADTLYGYSLPENAQDAYDLDKTVVKELFHVIEAAWTGGNG